MKGNKMIRHISIFFLQEEGKEENGKKLKQMLEELGNKLSGISGYYAGCRIGANPPAKAKGMPEFGDLVQIIDFEDMQSAASYPSNPEHKRLVEESADLTSRVVAIDIDMEDI